jgi:hypothetical protein
MNIEEMRRDSATIKVFTDRGAEIIAELKNYIAQELPTHLIILSETPHMLCVSYYGCRFIFRIEIGIFNTLITAKIRALLLSYDVVSKETYLGVGCEFDRFGNIDRSWTPKDFPQAFISNIFKYVNEGTILLRP